MKLSITNWKCQNKINTIIFFRKEKNIVNHDDQKTINSLSECSEIATCQSEVSEIALGQQEISEKAISQSEVNKKAISQSEISEVAIVANQKPPK